MTLDKKVRVFAGSMILGSLALSLVYGNGWLLLTAFVGANLIQSAFTGFCPAEKILGCGCSGTEGSCK